MFGRITGIGAMAVFIHLWWRAGGGPYAGPAFLDPADLPARPELWDLWLLATFYAFHSILASRLIKHFASLDSVPYRKFYLGVSLLTALFVWLAWLPLPDVLWEIGLPWSLVFYSVQAIGVAGYHWTLKGFDLSEFFGERATRGNADLVASGPYALCRHPMYFFGFLVLCTPHMNAGRALLAFSVVAYAMLGSRFEEARLLREWGEPYQRYRANTPWLFPSPRSIAAAFKRRS